MSLEESQDHPRSSENGSKQALDTNASASEPITTTKDKNDKPMNVVDSGSFNDDPHKNDVGASSQDNDNNNGNGNQQNMGKDLATSSQPEPASPAASAPADDGEPEPTVIVDPVQKEIYEQQREEIMALVPESVKGRFGEIAYAAFGKYFGPVLILDPYHVSPGQVRDSWFKMFHNCKAGDRLKNMTHLVYWYGMYDNVESAYSFLPSSKLVEFEAGKKRVQPKLEALFTSTRARVTNNDLTLQNGCMEMEEDRDKKPSLRSGYMARNFIEVYEHIIEPGQEYVPTPLPPVPYSEVQKKTKKGVKRKLMKEEDEAVPTKKDEKTGKAKKKKKKSVKSAKTADKEASTETSVPLKKRKKKLKQLKETSDAQAENDNAQAVAQPQVEVQPVPPVEENRMSAYDEYMLAVAEERSHGDTDDEDLDIAGLGSDDDDDAEENYLSDGKSDQKKAKPTRSKESRTKSSKEPPKKRGTKAKARIEKRPKGEKKAPAEEARRRAEQRRFEVCEQKYAPLIQRWKRAISNKDADQISRIYTEVLGVVGKFTAPFIEVHELSIRMKESKKILNNDERKELLGKLKTQYTTKKQDVPAGFVPQTDSDEPSSASAAGRPEQKALPKVSTPQKAKSKSIVKEEKEALPRKKLIAEDESEKKASKTASGGPTTPTKSLDTKPEQPSSQQLNSKQPVAVKVDKKKKFSLGKLVRRPSSVPLDPSDTKAAQPRASPATLPPPSPKAAKTPIWMSQVSEAALQVTDQNRRLALEFLRQAAPFVPLRKGVNLESIARNLEVAIFDWANSEDLRNGSVANGHGKSDGNGVASLDGATADKYWNKLHSLVAGISGKHQAGTIAAMIGQGKFETPNDLVQLSDDTLYLSFQGKPLSGS